MLSGEPDRGDSAEEVAYASTQVVRSSAAPSHAQVNADAHGPADEVREDLLDDALLQGGNDDLRLVDAVRAVVQTDTSTGFNCLAGDS